MRLARPKRLDGSRQAPLNEFGTLSRDPTQVRWRRSGRKHQGKCNHREAEPGDAGRKEHVVHVGNIEAEKVKCHMFQWFDVFKSREREEEEKCR